MDTSGTVIKTDKLGRRLGPRRKYTLGEKRAMVEETRRRGASVAEVAQRHGVNANLLFGWRRLHLQGALCEPSAEGAVTLLPVKVTAPTLLPEEPGPLKPVSTTGAIEIEYAGGQRVRIRGRVDRAMLAHVMAMLSRR
jgi:transposase